MSPAAKPPIVTVSPILDGGLLPGPIVPKLSFEDGRHWIELAQEHTGLTRFLTGMCFSKRPLMKVTVIKQLMAMRNKGCRQAASPDAGDDGVAELGLDDSASSPVKRRKQGEVMEPPDEAFVECEYERHDGSKWVALVLRGSSNKKVHLEFTTENMQILFAETRQELAVKGISSIAETDDQPEKMELVKSGVKGIRWKSKRSAWEMRWVESSGKPRCKTWSVERGLSPMELETAREQARLDAVNFREGLVAAGVLK
jgi:hypothetical protein